MAAILIIDIDGYRDEKKLFRPRELGWTLLRGNIHKSGSIYFYDEGLKALSRYKKASKHKLPRNPDNKTFVGERTYTSAEMKKAVNNLCRQLASTVKHIFITHKGGFEGTLVESAARSTILNLEHFGCPKVEQIAENLSAALPKPCCYHTARRRVVHCPRLETYLFGQWILGGVVSKENALRRFLSLRPDGLIKRRAISYLADKTLTHEQQERKLLSLCSADEKPATATATPKRLTAALKPLASASALRPPRATGSPLHAAGLKPLHATDKYLARGADKVASDLATAQTVQAEFAQRVRVMRRVLAMLKRRCRQRQIALAQFIQLKTARDKAQTTIKALRQASG